MVETIIYIAIIGMVIGAFITFILVLSGMRNKFYAIGEVRANKRAMGEIFDFYIRNAKGVTVPAKQGVDSHLDFLAEGNASGDSFFEKDGRLLLFDGVTSTPLTSNDVIISALRVENLSTSGTPDALVIQGNIRTYASSSVEYAYEEDFKYNISLPL